MKLTWRWQAVLQRGWLAQAQPTSALHFAGAVSRQHHHAGIILLLQKVPDEDAAI